MIERLLIKEYLSFDEAQLEFQKGLVVFTGPSGAGKSILINALLALFGLKPVEARVSEAVCDFELDLEEYGIERDEVIVVRAVKKEKVRYFLGDQALSKKALREIFAPRIAYLHQKEQGFFESEHLLFMAEGFVADDEYFQVKKEYEALFEEFKEVRSELEELRSRQKNIEEQKEFLEFEIQKIASIEPKPGEYEELMSLKKELSKKEKIAQAIREAEGIFEYESRVYEVFGLLDLPSDFFDEAMNELKDIFYTKLQQLEELEEIDAEELLERLEKLSSLKRRYGSIEEALEVLEKKRAELAKIENIELSEKELETRLEQIQRRLQTLADRLSRYREEAFERFEGGVNELLRPLKLPRATFRIQRGDLGASGQDRVQLELKGISFKKISSGEYNRLRLAVMAAWNRTKEGGGVLIVDEIDANISGEESMAVAKILKSLSKNYQIFAISHQAQLASLADQHFLVTKDDKSRVREIKEQERQREIARIISGEEITKEALEYAKRALKEAG